MRKKLLSVLLAISMIAGLVPTWASAESAEPPIRQFATQAQLVSQFNLSGGTAGKVYFGSSDGYPLTWHIVGAEKGQLVLFADGPGLTGMQFNRTGTGTVHAYANHYGISDARAALQTLAETGGGLFSANERKLIRLSEASVETSDTKNSYIYTTSDPLYLPASLTWPGTDTVKIYAGSEDQFVIPTAYWGSDSFWLRSPHPTKDSYALIASTDKYVSFDAVTTSHYVRPVFHLETLELLFGSTAKVSNGAVTMEDTMTLRMKGYDLGTATFNENMGSVILSGVPSGTYLVAQNSQGAAAITATNGTVSASAFTIGGQTLTSFEGCKVWLEQPDADSQFSTATLAQKANEVSEGATVSYLDASGTEQSVTMYTELTGSIQELTSGWYVARKDVSIHREVPVTGDVNLILMDGCDLQFTESLGTGGGSLTIYGQRGNTGQLTVGDFLGFHVRLDTAALSVYGGQLDLTGIDTPDVTISGNATVSAVNEYGDGIVAEQVNIGGNAVVTASGDYGIYCQGPVTVRGQANVTVTGSYAKGICGATKVSVQDHANLTVTGKTGGISSTQVEFLGGIVQTSSLATGFRFLGTSMVFVGTEGKLYGTEYTLAQDLTIPEGHLLTIAEGQTLTIPNNVTLTNQGTILNLGTLTGEVSGSVVTRPDNLTATYGQTLANVSLPAGWTWRDNETTSVGNAGTNRFQAIYKPNGAASSSGVTTWLSIEVAKATPSVQNVKAVSGDTLYDGMPMENVLLTGECSIKGTLAFPEGQKLDYDITGHLYGKADYYWIFTPDDTDNYKEVGGTVNLTVSEHTVTGIAITQAPTYTSYDHGDTFDKSGMVVTATYSDNHTATVTDYVAISPTTETTTDDSAISKLSRNVKTIVNTSTAPNGSLSLGTTSVTISFGGHTKTLGISVGRKAVPEPNITLVYTSHPCTGEVLEPAVTVKDGDTIIPSDEYAVTYTNSTSVGTATVTITDNNENGNYVITETSATFQITKADPSYTIPTDLTAVYGQTLVDVPLPHGWTWNDPTTDVGAVGVNTFQATFTPNDTDNYNVLGDLTLTVAVSRKPLTIRANDLRVTPGSAIPSLTWSTSGLAAWDTFTAPTLTTTAQNTDTLGAYPITIRGGTLTNPHCYDVTYVPGTLTVAYRSSSSSSRPVTPPADQPSADESHGTLPFTDVTETDWFYDSVRAVHEKGLMNGTGDTTFAPQSPTTRAMVWTILARIAGQSISGDTWADQAQTWATAEGVSDGTDPNGNITREQLAVMLYRCGDSLGLGTTTTDDRLAGYPDGSQVSSYATQPMNWAIAVGILTGDDQGRLTPTNHATRAEVSAMLTRFCGLL